MGSNPISPAMDPSSFSGRTKKGMDLDISSAFKATEARCAWGMQASREPNSCKGYKSLTSSTHAYLLSRGEGRGASSQKSKNKGTHGGGLISTWVEKVGV